MDKKVFGLDVGANSVGWAAVTMNFENQRGSILGLGSRILPMDQAEIGDFNKGALQSAAAERTKHRGVRRLRERQLKRRDRLVRVLKVLKMIPSDWEPNNRYSFAFVPHEEKTRFKFQDAYHEMKAEFLAAHPSLTSVSHDWTIYYLRKKALSEKISLEELAWIILQFNVKRGYYQLRGDDSLTTDDSKYFVSDRVISIEDGLDDVKGRKLFLVTLECGIVGEYRNREMPDWLNKEVEFIVAEKKVKDQLKVTLSSPDPTDWTLRKKKTEENIKASNKSVGEYIYDKLLANPYLKIRGQEVHTVDRSHYKNELLDILSAQVQYHSELASPELLHEAAKSLYQRNEAHRNNLIKQGVVHLLVEDIIFYQRPLKTKKHLIANCKYESYHYKDKEGNSQRRPIKGIAKSHPLYQEFRIWSVIHNIRVAQNSFTDEDGILRTDHDITDDVLSPEAKVALFETFDKNKEVSHDKVLKALGLNKSEYKINYEEGQKLKGNELKAAIIKVTKSIDNAEVERLLHDEQRLEMLWHALYSLGHDLPALQAALAQEGLRLSRPLQDALADVPLQKRKDDRPSAGAVPLFSRDYGAFSKKALKKLLPLMRVGSKWDAEKIHPNTVSRIDKISSGEVDDTLSDSVRDKLADYDDIRDFQGCSLTIASYVAYGRHSEVIDATRFASPDDIDINKLVPNHGLRNPTVEKIVRETLLVVRDMWKRYGRPDEIHVEMARELKLGAKKRKEYTDKRNENHIRNQRAKAMLLELSRDDHNVNPYSIGHLETFKIYEEGAVRNEKNVDKDIAAIRKKGDPTRAELTRYKLWLEQKYLSPYTGQPIPLSRLFTDEYEIEHIIPKTLYYDDSFNNKIICERSANRFKDNRTAYEMVCNSGGHMLEDGKQILDKEAYEALAKSMFASINYKKYKTLLQYDPPKGFAARQLNNTRYINRKLLEVLSPIVREEGEQGATSKHVIPMQGGVTSELKNDWGLHDVWKRILAPRFQRMNEITGTTDYYNKEGNRIDLSGYENEIKRLDHRHHALDALVIACTTRSHVAYKNSLKSDKKRFDLRDKLLLERDAEGRRHYRLPWDTIAADAYSALSDTIVSFKNNRRIINKTINYYQKYIQQSDGTWKKGFVKQKTNHDHWAIRKPLHQETIYGRGKQVIYKSVRLSEALQHVELIADRRIKRQLRQLVEVYKGDLTKLKKYLKLNPLSIDGEEVTKIHLRIIDDQIATSQLRLDPKVTEKQLLKIVDSKLSNELVAHLKAHNGKADEAFSDVGLAKFNKHRQHPVKAVKVMQDLGIAFPLGDNEDTAHKYGKGAKGTNLVFVIYKHDETGEHKITSESTMSFHDLMEVEKANEEYAEAMPGYSYFTLSPGDLVYVLRDNEQELPEKIDVQRVYKCVSFTKRDCFFVMQNVSSVIANGKEFSVMNKQERSIDGIMIKNRCVKLNIDRLGTIV